MEFVSESPAVISAWDAPEAQGGLCPTWFNEKKCFGDKVVKACVVGGPASLCMSLGSLVKMKIEFEDGSSTHVVVKKESTNPQANKFAAKVNCYGTEGTFYNDFAPSSSIAKVPKCYYASVSPSKEATTLILEDVSQAEGANPGDTHTSLTLMQLQAAVIELGKFHGAFHNMKADLQAKARSAEQHAGQGKFNGAVALSLFFATWDDLLKEFDPEDGGEEATKKPNEEPPKPAATAPGAAPAAPPAPSKNKVRAVFTHIAEFHANWVALLGVGLGGVGLVHGDCKGTNIMFEPKSGAAASTGAAAASASAKPTLQATLLDFQTTYLGGDVARADDLNYLIVGSVDQNTRLAHEDTMIKFYLEAFDGAMKKDDKSAHAPKFAEFKHYYKMATQGILYRCMSFNMFMGNAPVEVRRAQLQTLVSRACDAIVDHGMYEVLAVGRR